MPEEVGQCEGNSWIQDGCLAIAAPSTQKPGVVSRSCDASVGEQIKLHGASSARPRAAESGQESASVESWSAERWSGAFRQLSKVNVIIRARLYLMRGDSLQVFILRPDTNWTHLLPFYIKSPLGSAISVTPARKRRGISASPFSLLRYRSVARNATDSSSRKSPAFRAVCPQINSARGSPRGRGETKRNSGGTDGTKYRPGFAQRCSRKFTRRSELARPENPSRPSIIGPRIALAKHALSQASKGY